MADETCSNCRSWEEEIYWTHFQSKHFAQFLHSGFDQQLAIPEKFTKNLKGKLPDIVTLKSPSGAAWKVGLTRIDEHIVFFSHGWTEFVKDHDLEVADFLVFKYNGEAQFDVLIFEGLSMCEKAASYFVRKCNHDDSGSQLKRKNGERFVEVIADSPMDNVGGSQPGISTPNGISRTPATARQRIVSQSQVTKRTQRENRSHKRAHTWDTLRIGEPSASPDELETKPDVNNTSRSHKRVRDNPHVSNASPVTEEEKKKALQLAQAALTDEGFIAVMRPSSVSGKYFMSIPSSWMNKHLPSLENQNVILRFEENTWTAKFYHHTSRNSGGLSVGWKNFVMDNKLNESDVCVFEPGGLLDDSMVLDVSIFRVVDEPSPIIPFTESWEDLLPAPPGFAPHNSIESHHQC